MVRVLSLVWVIVTLAINVFAIAALLQGFGLDDPDWKYPFEAAGDLYIRFAEQGFSTISGPVLARFGYELPFWGIHGFVIYAGSASAVAASGSGLYKRNDFIEVAGSAGLSLIWPLALFAFVFKSILIGSVTKFSVQHRNAITLYLSSVVTIYVGSRLANIFLV